MPKLKRITHSEWNQIPREYRGASQVEDED